VRRLLALVVAVALGVSGCAGGAPDTAKPSAAKRLPDLTLPALGAGPDIDLGALRGPLVVNTWASWCKPCRRELPIYGAFARKHAGKVAVVGIDYQDTKKDKAVAMLRTAKADYPVAYDFEGRTRSFGLPRLTLLDAAGKVVYAEYVEIKSLAQLEKIVADHLGAAG
jgi:thiol-disulfide isomerase/thioredoxin